jgi:hypothetical protein
MTPCMLIRPLCAALAILLTSSCQAERPQRELDESATLREVKKIVAEYRVYATCLSLDAPTLALVESTWQKQVAAAIEALRELKPGVTFIASFTLAVRFSNLLDPDMKLSQAMDLCHKNPAAAETFWAFGNSRLTDAVRTLPPK